MARVIKEAFENEDLWRGQFTCTGAGWEQHGTVPCGRLIEVLASDIVARKHTDYGGGTDVYYGFHCPVCNSFTEIPYTRLNSTVRSMANSKSHI